VGNTSLRVLVLLLSAFSIAASAQVDWQLYSGLDWRLIGPFRAGRTVAVTGVPGQTETFYFGAVVGGVWRTSNAGRTWTPIFDQVKVGSIGAVAVSPSDANVIYVGSGEADMRSDISEGNGISRSTDGGKTWTDIGLHDTQAIGRVLVDPHDPNRVFVAALGHPYGPNAERGVFRSTDGGRTWQKVLYNDENTGAIDLAFDPRDSSIIYATMWRTRRPPWNVYPPSNGPGSGLYKSTDGGNHWQPLANGLPTDRVGRIGVAVAPSDPNRVYALVDAKNDGVYRSDDAGTTWRLADNDARIWGRGWYFGGITVDPKNPDVLYVMNTSTYRSMNGGKTFDAIKGAPGGDDYHQLWIYPDDPARMVLASDQGPLSQRTAPRPGVPGTTSLPRSSTTSWPTTASLTGYTARSRTAARSVLPAAATPATYRFATGWAFVAAAKAAMSLLTRSILVRSSAGPSLVATF
jgi:photosystem II stability/assembly factor-like uncharacterized protein